MCASKGAHSCGLIADFRNCSLRPLPKMAETWSNILLRVRKRLNHQLDKLHDLEYRTEKTEETTDRH
jgi:hypothetical protein